MKVSVQASVVEIDAREVMESLPAEARARVAGKRAVVYAIGENGTSRPRVIGEDGAKRSAVLTWPKSTIRRLAEAVKSGTKLFERHGKDNSHEGRKPLGEVIGTFTREIGDKLQAVAVTVLSEDRPDLDVCSVEADADIDAGSGLVGDVDDVSAIALSSSKVDSPAFAGAQRLAVLQCFGEPAGAGHKDDAGETGKPGEGKNRMEVTFDDVKKFVRERNVFPNQLFTLDDLKNDRTFAPILQAGETAKAERDSFKAKAEELEKSSAAAIRKNAEAEARGRLEKLIPEGSTDRQKAFYLRRFDPAKLEKLDDEALKKHLEAEALEYAETAKLFGVAEQTPPAKKPDGGGAAGEVDPVEAALKETIGGKQ